MTRNTHPRGDTHHLGDLPAALVRLTGDLLDNVDLEAAIAVLDQRLDLTETPALLYDDKTACQPVEAPAPGFVVRAKADASSFTADATDPAEIAAWAADSVGSYSSWLRLHVSTSGTWRIYTTGPGMRDTIMAIWGPSDDPPGASDDPYHLGDDNTLGSGPNGTRSSLHDVGSDPNGTHFVNGDGYSEDDSASGIALTSGTWWICVWPYLDLGWDPAEGLVTVMVEGLST